MVKALIDGDILVYKTAYSVETPIYVVKGAIYKTRQGAEKAAQEKNTEVHKRVNIGSEHDLRKRLKEKMDTIYSDLGVSLEDCKVYITDSELKNNFRTKIATSLPYKGNRVNRPKPYHYNKIREILVKDYGAEIVSGMETDDRLAIEQTKFSCLTGGYDNSIIVSVDKDMLTIPGQHYNIDSRTIVCINKDKALKNFCRQILIGDPTDNIPGLVKLLKLFGRNEEAQQLIDNKYIKKFEQETVSKTAEQTYLYLLQLFDKHRIASCHLYEIMGLVWLLRYEGQDCVFDVRKDEFWLESSTTLV